MWTLEVEANLMWKKMAVWVRKLAREVLAESKFKDLIVKKLGGGKKRLRKL